MNSENGVSELLNKLLLSRQRACPNRIEIENRKTKMKINRAPIGAWFKHVPLRSLGYEKMRHLQPIAKIKKLSAEIEEQIKARTATIQRVLLVSAATSGYHIRTAVHSTQPTASTATQPHRSPVNSQQANHNNSPDVLGPLFPGVRAKAKRSRDGFSMMPSRTRLEVRSQYNLKFDPGASTSDAPPPPWEAQRPPGVEMSSCMPAALVDLCC